MRAWFTACRILATDDASMTAVAMMLERGPVRLVPQEGYTILSQLAWHQSPV